MLTRHKNIVFLLMTCFCLHARVSYAQQISTGSFSVKEVCPREVYGMARKGVVLVDVREPHEVKLMAFDAPNVLYIPLSEWETRWREIPQDCAVVMVCRRGVRSRNAARYLASNGYRQMSNLEGGILKWTHKGLPVKR